MVCGFVFGFRKVQFRNFNETVQRADVTIYTSKVNVGLDVCDPVDRVFVFPFPIILFLFLEIVLALNRNKNILSTFIC